MSTPQSLARLGSVSAVVGAVLLFVSTLLHPLDSDPNDLPAAFAEYAADPLWVWSHLGQFVGVALIAGALIALATTLEAGWAAAWGRVGLAGAAAIIAVAAALQAVDGVALKAAVDRWAAATGEARALAFEAAYAIRQIEVGLASLLSLLSGATVAVFGVSVLLSTRYPSWVGGVGMLDGLGLAAAGAAQASTGFSEVAMLLSMLASSVLILWVILVGILLWRLAPQLAGDRAAAE